MRAIYRNTTIVTQDLHKEILKYHFREVNTAQKKLFLLLAGVSAVMLVFALLRGVYISAAISAVSVCGSVFLAYNNYLFAVKYQHEQFIKSEPTARREYSFGPDRYEVIVPAGKVPQEYQKLKKILDLPEVFLLVLEDQTAQPLDKKGFTKGDPEQFKAFLQEKIDTAPLVSADKTQTDRDPDDEPDEGAAAAPEASAETAAEAKSED